MPISHSYYPPASNTQPANLEDANEKLITMENEIEIEPLIKWVVGQIVVSDDGGVSVADLLALIEAFYERNQRESETSSGYLINLDNAPTQDKTLGERLGPKVDHNFRAKFWDRLKVHPDVIIGENRTGNALTLEEVLSLPIRSHTSDSDLNHYEQVDTDISPHILDTLGRSFTPNGGGASFSNNDWQPKVSVSEDYRWQTIAGHGVDYMRIPHDEWSYLCAVAAAGAKGITIADAIRITGQDKRYSSLRTNSLELKDYIEKRQIRVPSITRPTSLLVLKKYSNHFAAADAPTEVLTQHLDPVPGYRSWTGKFIDTESFARAISAVVKAWQIINYTNLQKKLGVDPESWQHKMLRLTLQDFHRNGVVEINTSEMGSNASEDTIRFLRDLNETDLSRFRRTPTGQPKPAQKSRFSKPRKSTEQSDMIGGDAEEDELSLIEFYKEPVQAAEGISDPFLKEQSYSRHHATPRLQELVKTNSEDTDIENHVLQAHTVNQNEGSSDGTASQQLKVVAPPAESIASPVPRRTNRSRNSRSIHRDKEAEKISTPKISDTELSTPNSVAVSRTPKRLVGRPPKSNPQKSLRPSVSKVARFMTYDDYMRQDGIPGVYFNVSDIPRPVQAARKKNHLLAVFVSQKLKDIPWMHFLSTVPAASEKSRDEFKQGPLVSQTSIKDSAIPPQQNPRPIELSSDAVTSNNTGAAESVPLNPVDALVAPKTSQHRLNNIFAISSSGRSAVNMEHSFNRTELSTLKASFQKDKTEFPHSSSQNELCSLAPKFVGIMQSHGTSSAVNTSQSQSSKMMSYVSPYKSPYITKPKDINAEIYSSPYKSPYGPAAPSLLSNQHTLSAAQPSFSAPVASPGFEGVPASAVAVKQNLHSVTDARLAHKNVTEQSSSLGSKTYRERRAQNKAARGNVAQEKVAPESVAKGKTIQKNLIPEEPSRQNLAQEKVIQERLTLEKTIDERLYTSIQAAEVAAPRYSSCLLACSKDGVAGILFLTEDKVQLKFVPTGSVLNAPTFVLRVSNITLAPSTSAPGSKPMELLLHTGDPEDATATTHRFRFLENNQSLEGANYLRAKLVTVMTVGQFKSTNAVPNYSEKNIKSFKCTTCAGSWKNSEGLRYHQSKAQTSCNPNWKGEPRRASRPSKTPSSVSEAHKNTYEKLTEKYQEPHQSSKCQSPLESKSLVLSLETPVTTKFLLSQSHILESYNSASETGTELRSQLAKSKALPKPDAIAGNVGISHGKSAQNSLGLVSGDHYDYQTPSNLPSSHGGRTDLPQASSTQERFAVPQNQNLVLTGTNSPPKRGKIIAADTSFGDTQRQKIIIKSLLDANDGVFVGDEGLWYAVVAAWIRDFPNTVIPEQKYCKEAVQFLENERSIIRHLFTFKDVIGVMQTRSIITRLGMEPFDPKSLETKREIKKTYPDSYVPAEFAPSDEVLSKLKGRGARIRNLDTSYLDMQNNPLMFGDDVEFLNNQSRDKISKRSQKRDRSNKPDELLQINSSENERGHEGPRRKRTKHRTEEAKEQHPQKLRKRWGVKKRSRGKRLASGIDAHPRTQRFSSLSTQNSLDESGFDFSGSNSHQDRDEGNYLIRPLTTDCSGRWSSSNAFIQDPHTVTWSQKIVAEEGLSMLGTFPEPVTYIQSPGSSAWNVRPVGHGAIPVHETTSEWRNTRTSVLTRPASRKQRKPTAGRNQNIAPDSVDLDDENLLDYIPQQEESTFLTEKLQPERTKRQYNKSGRYSKRNPASKTLQIEQTVTQPVNDFRYGPPKQQSVWRHYTRLVDDQDMVLRGSSRLKYNVQTLAYSQEYSRRLQALRRGYPHVRFLDPNTALFDGPDNDDRILEIGFKGNTLAFPQVFGQVIDNGSRQHLTFQFQAPFILRSDQGNWPDLAETIFDKGSYSMQGWFPSADFILRHNLPNEVEIIYGKDWESKVSLQAATSPDPQSVRFAAEMCQVQDWEQGIAKDLLQIGTLAPNYMFFNHTIDSLKRTDEVPTVNLQWLPQFSFILDSIPYDELEQNPHAVALSVIPALATQQGHRKRKTVAFLSDEIQDQESQESDFEIGDSFEESKRYPRRRAKRVRYTIPSDYFTEQPVAAPTVPYPEIQYPNFPDFDIRDPDFRVENLGDKDIDDRDFQDQEARYRQRKPTQQQHSQNQLHVKSLQKSRRQVATHSDLTGLHSAISKDPNFKVEIDFATSSVGRRRSRKLEEKAISAANDHRILITVVIIQTLTGGIDKTIDWILVTKQFPLHTLTSIQRRWKSLSKKHEVMLERITSEFEDMFLEAYERSEIPTIDYDHLLDYDWKYLIDWVVEKMDSMDISLQNMHRLPTSRNKFSQLYNIQDAEASSKSVLWRDEWFNQRSAVQLRIEGVSSVQFTNPLARKPDALRYPDDLAVAKSWLRASLLTPSESYNTEYTERKMAKFDKDILNAAVNGLLEKKVITSKYKGRVGPGRGYEMSDTFFASLRKSVEKEHFAQAATFKTLLDANFRAKEVVKIEWTAEDGVILAITNLQAHGRIKLVGQDIPMQSFGLIPDGFYETKKMPKMRLHFEIEVIPTENYIYDDDHQILKRLPLLAFCPPRGTRHALPVWYDITEQLLPDMWTKVLAAVLGTMALRPGMTITELTRVFAPAMEEWELRCLVEWGMRLGVLDMMVEGHEGWNTGEWWWLVVGRCLNCL